MASEYDPMGASGSPSGGDLAQAQALFADASRAYLSSSWGWLGWAVLLPAAALSTRPLLAVGGWPAGLALWSITILAGGLVEGIGILRGRGRYRPTELGRWVMRSQGNLSLVAVILSAILVLSGFAGVLPGVWLLLLGHSFYTVGGLGFPPFRGYGLWLQLGGLASFIPRFDSLVVFAVVMAVGNLRVAWAIQSSKRSP